MINCVEITIADITYKVRVYDKQASDVSVTELRAELD